MKEFLRTLAMLSLVRMAADVLLPDGAMRRISDVLIGLIQMLSMLRALERLLHGGLGW